MEPNPRANCWSGAGAPRTRLYDGTETCISRRGQWSAWITAWRTTVCALRFTLVERVRRCCSDDVAEEMRLQLHMHQWNISFPTIPCWHHLVTGMQILMVYVWLRIESYGADGAQACPMYLRARLSLQSYK